MSEPAGDAPPDDPRKAPARRPRPGVVGPLFGWELVRLARRGQDARARFILAGGLFVVLTGFTLVWFNGVPAAQLFFGTGQYLTLEQSAEFGGGFSLAFVLGQLGVLCLLAPVYAAGGIAEEKERKTYPFLLVSDLTDREIVFGKFLGRLCFLLGVMFAGLPVLAMTQVYGGVSVDFLLMGYLLTATTVTLLAAVGVACAAHAETFRGAMFRSYSLAALHALTGCGVHPAVSPLGVLVVLYTMLVGDMTVFYVLGVTYAGCQLVVAAVAVRLAVRGVGKSRAEFQPLPPPPRPRRRSRSTRPADPAFELPPVVVPAVRAEYRPPRDGRANTLFPRPPVDEDDPFTWKERYVTGLGRDEDDESIQGIKMAGGLVVVLCVAFLVFAAGIVYLFDEDGGRGLAAMQGMLVFGGSVAVFVTLLAVGLAACGTVVRERARLTLESLLAIPVARADVLGAKWRASANRGWWWGVPAAGCLAIVGGATDTPVAAVPMAGYVLGCGLFAASYGLWLSVRCVAVTRAGLWFLPAAGALTALPIVAWVFVDDRPVLVCLSLTFTAVGLTAGSGVFWSAALSAFEKDGR